MHTPTPPTLKRFAALGAAGLLTLQAAAPGIAAASAGTPAGTTSQISSGISFNVGQLGLGSLRLDRKAPSESVAAPLPAAWTGARISGALQILTSGSRPGETLQLVVNGNTVAQTALHDGPQSLPFATGPLTARAASFTLRAAGDGLPGAKINIEPTTSVTIHRIGLNPLPSLSSLPGAMANPGAAYTAPVTVATPLVRSPTVLRTAFIAAGAVAKATGYPGIRVNAAPGATQQQLATAPGPVIRIVPTPAGSKTGQGTLSLSYLPSGELELSIGGSGNALIGAARLLSSPWIRTLSGSSATISGSLERAVAGQSAPVAQEQVGAGQSSGNGKLSVTRLINVPVDRVVAKNQAVLRMGISYNAPGGGRVTVKLNGNTLGSYDANGDGSVRTTKYRLASNWDEGGNLLPGYYMRPGLNVVTVTASQQSSSSSQSASLAIAPGSALSMNSVERPVTQQVGLWPFPFYGADGWRKTTVVLPSIPDLGSVSGLISAMANSERITGVPADPQVTFKAPTASQRTGNMIVVGNPSIAAVAYGGPITPGLLAETSVPYGGIALIAGGAQAWEGISLGYEPGIIQGKSVEVSFYGRAHTLESAPYISAFGQPSRPWLAPLALLAVVVLGWISLHVARSRRRLVDLPDMSNGEAPS